MDAQGMLLDDSFAGNEASEVVRHNRKFEDVLATFDSPVLQELACENSVVAEKEDFFPGGHSLLLRLSADWASGKQETTVFGEDVAVISTNLKSFKKQAITYAGENWIVLQFCVSGAYQISVNECDPQTLLPGDCRLDILSGPATWTRRQLEPTNFRSFVIYLKPRGVHRLLDIGDRARAMLEALTSVKSRQSLASERSYIFEASESVMESVNQISEFGAFGGLRPAYMRAKAVEFLVYGLHQASLELGNKTTPRGRRLASKDVKVAFEAKHIIDREFAAKLTVPGLAKRIGTNRTKLAAVFKKEFGDTIISYLQRVRLEKAEQMLRRNDGAVRDVAVHVGYADTSSFVRAYKRRFGITPGSLSFRHKA